VSTARDFSLPITMTAIDGIVAAVGAIPDAAVVIDAPSCIAFRGERVHGNHDVRSTLSPLDRPRLYSSNLTLTDLSMGLDGGLETFLERAGRTQGVAVVLCTGAAMVSVTGKQFVHILDAFEEKLRPALLEVPSRDLYGDWLDGYDDVMATLAKHLPLDKPEDAPPETDVAIVGYLMDRNEADHTANLHALRGLLGSIGLHTTCVWLSGEPTTSLQEAAKAGTILALPHGRLAAKALARRLGVRVVDAPLPVGLDQTAAFLRKVGAAFGRDRQAEEAIREGERVTLPELALLAPRAIFDRAFALSAEPRALEGMVGALRLMGARPRALFCPVRPKHGAKDLPGRLGMPVRFDPTIQAVRTTLQAQRAGGPLDLVIGDSFMLSGIKDLDLPMLEFGYPSYTTHHLVGMPYLGYTGMLGIAERFGNAVLREEFRRFGG